MAFVESIGFYETHIFKYSRRKGTAADKMEGQLTEAVKHERSLRLLDINKKKKREFEDRHIADGKTVEVLFEDVEEIGERPCRTGYTREYIKVYDESGFRNAGDTAEGTMERQGDIILFRGGS